MRMEDFDFRQNDSAWTAMFKHKPVDIIGTPAGTGTTAIAAILDLLNRANRESDTKYYYEEDDDDEEDDIFGPYALEPGPTEAAAWLAFQDKLDRYRFEQ